MKINKKIYNYVNDIIKINYYSDYVIIETKSKKYLYKNKIDCMVELIDFFKKIRYDYYLPIINDCSDDFELYEYYDEYDIKKESKLDIMIDALLLLHIKSTNYVELFKEDMKIIYDDIIFKIDYLMKYYLDLQDYIEMSYFPKPALYLLINNISKFYELLNLSRMYIEKWFEKENFKSKNVLLINELSNDNFVISDKIYFKNFSKVKRDLFIYDLVNFYKNNYKNKNVVHLINKYSKRFIISEEEYNLFYSLICIPDKIQFINNNLDDLKNVREEVNYVDFTINYISEKNKENKKTDEQKFKK